RAGPGALWSLDFERASLVERLAYTNAALVLFNLVPAFPMDGGRVLRALLAMALGLPQATRIAARIGQAFAVVFVVLGLFYNPFLIFIGLFIYIAAASEQQASDFRWFAHDLKVAAGMEAKVASLPRSASLADAVTALLASPQRDFPVVDEEGRPVGLLDREDLLATLRQDGPETPVAQVMRVAEPVRDTQPLEEAMAAMNREGLKAQIVVDSGGRLVGLLTRENIAEMMLIHAVRPDWRFSSGRRGI
ncbi:MAG: CBS domain-containing protein, partial [Rhizobiales bacterium]|nr:CBS domain-containing protein [Hyphomicrobiales bacterium]